MLIIWIKQKKRGDNITFNFTHRLCKVILTIQPGFGVSAADLNALTIKAKNRYTSQIFNLTTGEIDTNPGVPKDITLLRTSTSPLVYEAILLPDAGADCPLEFDLNDGAGAPFTWDMGTSLTAGHKYTYTITLGKNAVLTATVADITSWTTGTAGSGGAGIY